MSNPIDPTAIAPGQEVTIDLFRPEDAPGVAALFRIVYGEGYPIRTFIDPEELIRENEARRTISVVARTPQGEIVGHNALFNSAPFAGTYESGAGAVLPSYRAVAHIFTRMVVRGVELADEFGLAAIFGEPVCNHVYSQKMCASQGWISRALEVDLMPAQAYVQEKSAAGRVAALLYFAKARPRAQTVFAPPVYLEVMDFFYQDLGDSREVHPAEGRLDPGTKTRLETQVFNFAKVARVAVFEVGADWAEKLDRLEADLQAKGMAVTQFWLKSTSPAIGPAVDELRRRGYFLGGVLPRWFDDDGLLMQRLDHAPHWDGIQVLAERDRQMVSIVRTDWERTSPRP